MFARRELGFEPIDSQLIFYTFTLKQKRIERRILLLHTTQENLVNNILTVLFLLNNNGNVVLLRFEIVDSVCHNFTELKRFN